MSAEDTPRIVRLSDVAPERVQWLWPGRIPLGKLTILDGDPGVAKTTIMLDIAARISRGDLMPDGTSPSFREPRGTVLLMAEDGLGDTIRPRLDAAGADVSRIVLLDALVSATGRERSPTLYDIEAIREAIEAVDAALVIIDPITAYLGGNVDSHKDAAVRDALNPIVRLGKETNVAPTAIRHLNKKSEVGNALYRGGGSIAFGGAARSVLLAGKDPDDPEGESRILASVKCNLAPPQPSLRYRSVSDENGNVRIEWLGESQRVADDLVGETRRSSALGGLTKGKQAERFLMDALRDGPVPASEVKERAKVLGITDITLKRAKDSIVTSSKNGFAEDGCWMWALKEDQESRERNMILLGSQNPEKPHNERDSSKTIIYEDHDHLRAEEDHAKVIMPNEVDHLRETSSVARVSSASSIKGDHGSPPHGNDHLRSEANLSPDILASIQASWRGVSMRS